MVGSLYFWLIWQDGLCLGQIEAKTTNLGFISLKNALSFGDSNFKIRRIRMHLEGTLATNFAPCIITSEGAWQSQKPLGRPAL